MQIDAADIFIGITTLMGPILAVATTRWLDDRRAKFQRRNDIFTWFMLGRKAHLSPEFVKAMNLIDFEFKDEPEVIKAHEELMAHFVRDIPRSEATRRDFDRDRERLLTSLARALAESVGVKLEKSDYRDGGYYPSGWNHEAARQEQLRELLIEFLNGQRAVHVVRGQSTFFDPKTPPKPSKE